MNNKLTSFFLSQKEPSKSCFYALRNLLLKAGLAETIKYGMPCYTHLGMSLCYLWKDKNSQELYILFVDGLLLTHPSLQQGSRAKMKILLVDPNKDLDLLTIQSVIKEALEIRN